MWEKLQKIVLSLSLLALFALYALQRQAQPQSGASLAAVAPPTAAATLVVVPSATATATLAAAPTTPSLPRTARTTPAAAMARLEPTPTPRPAPTETAAPPTATASGAYRDGTYVGSQADANWGIVQVQVVIANGQISDVQFLQFPNHRSRSQDINANAMPILTQEAIQAQQAQVDVVSGATDTSDAFIESLGAALTQAAR